MKAVPNRHLMGCLAAFLAWTVVTVLAAAPASALVYWTTFDGDIGRANLNGTVVNETWIVSTGAPTGIAVDGNYVYWARYLSDTVGRANLDGTSPTNNWITSASNVNGVAVNGTYVYYANTDVDEIGRANLDGSSADPDWFTGGSDPTGIALDDDYIYWANYNSGTNSIGRAELDGSNPDDLFITGASRPSGIAVDGNYIYWTNYGSNSTIGRANLDGTGVNHSFITSVVTAISLTVDSNYIYWTNFNSDTHNIGRANLDGTGVDATWISDLGSQLRGIAVDATATPVTLVSFTARAVRGGVKVVWETAAEIDTAGFHVWRRTAQDEVFERISESMILGQGNPFQGADYHWLDTDLEPDTHYWYKLEDIDYAGTSAFHGPVRAVRKKKE